MEIVKKLEATFGDLHKRAPFNLPDGVRNWLATNSWWLVAVGVVLSALSVFSSLRLLFWTDSLVEQTRMIANSLNISMPQYNQNYRIALWVSVVTIVITLFLNIRAIPLLKELKKPGWDLLFLSFLVSLAGSLVSGLVQERIVSVVVAGLIAAVIGGFVLFEVRSKFNGQVARAASATPGAVPTQPSVKANVPVETEAEK